MVWACLVFCALLCSGISGISGIVLCALVCSEIVLCGIIKGLCLLLSPCPCVIHLPQAECLYEAVSLLYGRLSARAHQDYAGVGKGGGVLQRKKSGGHAVKARSPLFVICVFLLCRCFLFLGDWQELCCPHYSHLLGMFVPLSNQRTRWIWNCRVEYALIVPRSSPP